MPTPVRKTPKPCKYFFCKSDPFAVKTRGKCPRHYQRERRGDPAVCGDAEELLAWLYNVLGPRLWNYILYPTPMCRQELLEVVKDILQSDTDTYEQAVPEQFRYLLRKEDKPCP